MKAAGAPPTTCQKLPQDKGRREPQNQRMGTMWQKRKQLPRKLCSRKSTKPGLKVKRPAGRQPMPKARASTKIPKKPAPKEPVAAEGKKERKRGRWCKKV